MAPFKDIILNWDLLIKNQLGPYIITLKDGDGKYLQKDYNPDWGFDRSYVYNFHPYYNQCCKMWSFFRDSEIYMAKDSGIKDVRPFLLTASQDIELLKRYFKNG